MVLQAGFLVRTPSIVLFKLGTVDLFTFLLFFHV